MIITVFKLRENIDPEKYGLIHLSKNFYIHGSIIFLLNKKPEAVQYGITTSLFWRNILNNAESVYWLHDNHGKVIKRNQLLEKIFKHSTSLNSKVWVPVLTPASTVLPYELRHDFDESFKYKGSHYYFSYSGTSKNCVILSVINMQKVGEYTELEVICQPTHGTHGSAPVVTSILLKNDEVVSGGVYSLKISNYIDRIPMIIAPEKRSKYINDEHLTFEVAGDKINCCLNEVKLQTVDGLKTVKSRKFSEKESLYYNLIPIIEKINGQNFFLGSDVLSDRVIVNVDGDWLTLALTIKNITYNDKWKLARRYILLYNYTKLYDGDFDLLHMKTYDSLTIVNTKLLVNTLLTGSDFITNFDDYPYQYSTGIKVKHSKDEKELPIAWGVGLNRTGSKVAVLEWDSVGKNTYKLKIYTKRRDTETFLV